MLKRYVVRNNHAVSPFLVSSLLSFNPLILSGKKGHTYLNKYKQISLKQPKHWGNGGIFNRRPQFVGEILCPFSGKLYL